MKKINSYIYEKFNLIFLIIIFIQPILDLITSISINVFNINFSIGIIIRTLTMLFFVYYAIFIKKTNLKIKLFYFLLVGMYFILFSILVLTNKDLTVLFYELHSIIKIFYLPIILFSLHDVNVNINFNKLIQVFAIYIILIIIPTVLGISFNSYQQGKIGSVGWFNSGNEISAIISLFIPIFFLYISQTKNKLFNIIFVALVLSSIFFTGSKTTVISLFITVLYFSIYNIKKITVDFKRFAGVLIISFLVIISIIVILPKTNFYRNVDVHLNFLDITSTKDIFSHKFVNRFIFSDRLTLLENSYNNYKKANINEKILGIGYIENYNSENVNMKIIEMDIFDILFRTGLIGFVLFFFPSILYLKQIIREKNIEQNCYRLSFFLSITIAFLSGHVLVAPAVSIFVFVIIKNITRVEGEKLYES